MGTLEERKEYYARILSPEQACLHGEWRSSIRLNKAMDEKGKPWEGSIDDIVNACSKSLIFFGITGNVNKIDLSGSNHLPRMKENKIFIKLTETGKMAVIGHGRGTTTFLIPESEDEYDAKINDGYGKLTWEYNSPGILLHSAKERYNENLIILISVDVPAGLQIRDVKRGIGNYLTDHEGIPCIDYYNHRICRQEEVKK